MATGVAAAHSFAAMGGEIAGVALRTGMTVEALSELQSKISVEDLEHGFRHLQRAIFEAGEGSREASDHLARFGLTAQQLQALSPDEQLRLVADRFQAVRDPAARAGLALQVFGRSGTELIKILEKGSAGIDEVRVRSRELGLGMSTEDATAAKSLGKEMKLLEMQFKAIAFQIGAGVAPALKMFVQFQQRAVAPVIQWIRANREVVTVVFAAAAAIVGLGTALAALGGYIILASHAFRLFNLVTLAGKILYGIVSTVVSVAMAGAWLVYAAAVGIAKLALLAFNVVLWAVTAPWALVAAGIAAVVIGLAALWGALAFVSYQILRHTGMLKVLLRHWETAKQILADVWAGIRASFTATWNALTTVLRVTLGFWRPLFGPVLENFRRSWENFVGFMARVWEGIIGPARAFLGQLGAQLSRIAGTAAGGFAATMARVGSGFSDAWTGILAAVRSGDLETIWEVALAALNAAWVGLRESVLSIGRNLMAELRILWADGWATIQAIFENVTFALRESLFATLNNIRERWGSTLQYLVIAATSAQAVLNRQNPAAASVRALRDFNRSLAGLGGGPAASREEEHQRRLEAIERQRQKAIGGGRGGALEGARDADAEGADAIDAALGRLADARTAAQRAAAFAEILRKKPQGAAGTPELGQLGQVSAIGTFSAAAAAGIGGGESPEARTARNTERMAAGVQQLVNAANNGGLVFA